MEREQCVQAKAKCHVGKAATSRDHEGLKRGLHGGKEWQEVKSAGQTVVRARCCYRSSLTFILRMLIMDRGEREGGPPGTGEGQLAVVRAELEESGNGSGDPGETSAWVQAEPDGSKDRRKIFRRRNPSDAVAQCLGKGEDLARAPVFLAWLAIQCRRKCSQRSWVET